MAVMELTAEEVETVFGRGVQGGDVVQQAIYKPIASATSIGPRRLIRLEHAVTTQRLRLRVTQASASPILSEFALFAE